MEDITLFRNKFRIRISELDSHGRLRLPALLEYLQETAATHAGQLKFHNADMMGENLGWVLTKLYIELESLEDLGESVTVESWASGSNRLYANRDFRILTEDGKELGRATSSWLVLDLESRRPAKTGELFKNIKEIERPPILERKFARLPRLESSDYEEEYSVNFNHLDINRHVNNVRYVDWLLETIPHDILKEKSPVKVELNFLAESLIDDRVTSKTAHSSGEEGQATFNHSIFCTSREKELLKARTEWE